MIKNKLIHWLKSHRPVLTTAGTIEAVYQLGMLDAVAVVKHAARSVINPVIHDLERLRANTWDQDKITHIQHRLHDNFMEDNHYGQTKQD